MNRFVSISSMLTWNIPTYQWMVLCWEQAACWQEKPQRGHHFPLAAQSAVTVTICGVPQGTYGSGRKSRRSRQGTASRHRKQMWCRCSSHHHRWTGSESKPRHRLLRNNSRITKKEIGTVNTESMMKICSSQENAKPHYDKKDMDKAEERPGPDTWHYVDREANTANHCSLHPYRSSGNLFTSKPLNLEALQAMQHPCSALISTSLCWKEIFAGLEDLGQSCRIFTWDLCS